MKIIRVFSWCMAAVMAGSAACGGDGSSSGPPTTPGGGPPAPAPNAIRLGDTLSRTFAAGATIDTLKLTADRVLRIHIDVQQTAAGNLGSLEYALIDPSTQASVVGGVSVSSATFLGADVADQLLRWSRLPHAGQYLLIVSVRASVVYAGGYRIRLVGSDPAPETASARLAFGDSVVESIDGPGDVDEFTLTGTKGTTTTRLFFRAETARATDTLLVELATDAQGPPTAFALSPGNDARPFGVSTDFIRLATADTVRIRVRSVNSATRGAYRLKWVRVDEAPEGVPAALVAGDTVSSSIEFPGDIDVFTFTGTPGKFYAAVMQSTSGRGDERLHFELVLPDAPTYDRLLSGTTPSLLEQMSDRFRGGTAITLRVSGNDDMVSRGSYRIAILPIDPGPERASAVLTYGDTITESIDLKADFDEFTIQARAGDTLIVYAQALGADTTQRLRVLMSGLTDASPLQNPYITDFEAVPGRVLRSSRSTLVVASQTGPYTLSVNGSRQYLGNGAYRGPYRLVAAKVSSGPESASQIVRPNDLVIETGDPPGEVDRFVVQGTPGQRIAVYSSAVPVPGKAGSTYLVFWGTFPMLGTHSDSLGWGGTGVVTLGSGPTYIDAVSSEPQGQPFQYRLWLYVVDRRPERTSPNVRIGDVVTGETLYPSADEDEFTLTGAPGAHFQGCIRNRESYSFEQRIELLTFTQGPTNTGFTNSLFSDTAPQCTSTQTMPSSGTATLRVSTQWRFGGPYELRIVAVP